VTERQGLRIHVTGVVQGVGFRPFVFALAERLGLTGWVNNTSAGVDIALDGPPAALAAFVTALRAEAPPLARIEQVTVTDGPPSGFATFEIRASAPIAGAYMPIAPDVATCPDCLAELWDPADRRHRYPFTNCTNCGPRFTIITDIPYDRPNTTMAPFPLCPDCAREYHDPRDRRFHAQPVACPVCGPRVWLEGAAAPGTELAGPPDAAAGSEAIDRARAALAGGAILAVKGLGGFHLACDAANNAAVTELRRRKLRVDKPFALMMPDLATVERHCVVTPEERALLASPERPIVLLARRADSPLARAVAPEQRELGVMLPYTPLHHLLLEPAPGFPEALVMTSGNLSEEPIATGNDEARSRLADLADGFLLHDRAIRTRCDDSVTRVFAGAPYPLRRSRGYAPFPVRLPWPAPQLLAAGAELKNTFCLTRDEHAFVSHHIGDLENYETLQAFEDGVAHFERLFRVTPTAVAHDLHPDYLATRYARERARIDGLPALGVQHHHAHIAACLAEHGWADGPVIGVALDGTGYGTDGAIWGGEVLVADYVTFDRLVHLAYVPLPGGDKAVREPWRVALSWLAAAGIPWDEDLPPVRAAGATERAVVRRQIETGLNAPPTSSAGRLFDAVAALAGVRVRVNYEAQAAIALEALSDPAELGAYPLPMDGDLWDARPLVRAVVADVRAGVAPSLVGARFHNGLADAVVAACQVARTRSGVATVALSGGVWQNVTLLAAALSRLDAAGFQTLIHRQVPANDGGLALGQAAVAARRLAAGHPEP
jgi:hydrogenase maturation protein HypF